MKKLTVSDLAAEKATAMEIKADYSFEKQMVADNVLFGTYNSTSHSTGTNSHGFNLTDSYPDSYSD